MAELISIIGVVTGIVGTLTGVASLVWHIINRRSKIVLEHNNYLVFPMQGTEQGSMWMNISFTVRNKGDKDTTLEQITVHIENELLYDSKKAVISGSLPHIKAASSEDSGAPFEIKAQTWDKIKDLPEPTLTVCVHHTFGFKKYNIKLLGGIKVQ